MKKEIDLNNKQININLWKIKIDLNKIPNNKFNKSSNLLAIQINNQKLLIYKKSMN